MDVIYDIILGMDAKIGFDRGRNFEVFQLGLVLNTRTIQPIRLAPFAAALTTCLLRFSVSACRQVLYFTNRLPLRTQEIAASAPTITPKLPR